MPREVFGYTVLSIKTAVLRGNVGYCTTVYKNRTLKSRFCFKFYPKCHLKNASELTLRWRRRRRSWSRLNTRSSTKGGAGQKRKWWGNCRGRNHFVRERPASMEHCPEVYAAEKREIKCDASMRSPRKWNALDPPKEHATADDSSEFWPELDNLGNKLRVLYLHCSRLLFCSLRLLFR